MHLIAAKQDCEDYRNIQQSGIMNSLMRLATPPLRHGSSLATDSCLHQQHKVEGLALPAPMPSDFYECSSLLNFYLRVEASPGL
jgi:hypothetical protein